MSSKRYMDEFEIEGIKTNIEYHKKIMNNSYFRKGELSTHFIQKRMGNGGG